MEEKKRVLPEGVGKKIVEALKQQTVSVEAVSEEKLQQNFETAQEAMEQPIQSIFEPAPSLEEDFSFNEDSEASLFDAFETEEQPQEKSPVIETPIKPAFQESIQMSEPRALTDYDLPQNVDILKKLISQLPAGVTRQTGAQIIRQTMEAMGISMNTVLQEAQMVQESLGESTKECINTIEEYKNNIRILEGKVKSYRKQAEQLGELISLFIITDKRN